MTGPFTDGNQGTFATSAIQSLADVFGTTIHDLLTNIQNIPFNDLVQAIRYVYNDSRGVNRTAAISQAAMNEIHSLATNLINRERHASMDLVNFISNSMRSAIQNLDNAITTARNDLRQSNQQYGQRSPQSQQLRNNIDSLENKVNQILTALNTTRGQSNTYDQFRQQYEARRNLYQQALNEDAQTYNNLGMLGKAMWNIRGQFGQGDQLLRKFYWQARSMPGYDHINALAYASDAMRAQGWASAKYIDPDYDPSGKGGQAGGSASRRTEADRFINRFVDALGRSPFAKKLSTLAQDGALALTLAWASKAPPWLQQTLLTAIALGIPQSLTMVLTTWGGQLLSNLLKEKLKDSIAPLIDKTGVGPILGGIGGALAGFALSNGIIDSVGRRKASEGASASQVHGAMGLSGLLVGVGGAIVATLGAIFAATLGPILAPFVIAFGVIAGIVGIVRGIFNLNKSSNEAQKEGLGFWQWLKDIWPTWLGGGSGSTGEGIGSPANNHYLWYPTGEEVKGDGSSLLGHRITSSFGKRIHPKGTGSAYDGKEHFHTGIDLAYKEGEEVFSNVSGSVIKVAEGNNGGFGNTVYVRDEYGVVHQYSHLKGIGNKITKGMSISRGTLLGQAGHTGYATGPHLHYQTMRDGVAIDPEAYAKEYESKQKAKDTVESVRRRNQEKQIKNAQEVSKKYQTPIPASNNTKDSQNLTWTEFILGAGICSVPFNK